MMIRFHRLFALGLATLSLIACGSPAPPPSSRAPDPEAPRDRLGHIVERYWDESASLSPWYSWGAAEFRYAQAPADAISPQALADALAIERRYLDNLHDVSRGGLDAESKLTYDIFRRERELTIESFTYPAELTPVNPYDALPQQFALMASGAERNALVNAKDFDRWQLGADAYVGWTNQAIANLREGLRRGYVLPRVVVEKSLPMLAALGEDSPSNVFYEALRASPESAADAGRAGSSAAVAAVVKDKILPAYRNLHDFLQHEYLRRSRDSAGLWALPLGDAWYAYLVKRATGGSHTPAELHAQGVAEVERLHGRMQALLAETAFAGNAQGFMDSLRRDPRFSYSSAAELLKAYQELKARAATAALISLPAAAPIVSTAAPSASPSAPGLVGNAGEPISAQPGPSPAALVTAASAGAPGTTPAERVTVANPGAPGASPAAPATVSPDTRFTTLSNAATGPTSTSSTTSSTAAPSFATTGALAAASSAPPAAGSPTAPDVPSTAPAVPTLFPAAPKADFEIRSVEGFRQATAPMASYRRAMAYGKNSAVLYVNAAGLDSRPATAVTAQFLREAVPGHHYQLSLQQERADLPKFRRFGGAPAFVEGWAVYATSLGDEMAMYHDAEARFGALLAQLHCAVGTVIDTGIHAQKWTRQQAIDYLHAQVPVDDESAANEIDRDLALPGNALACNVGFLKIQGLRAKAQQTLGSRFEARAFHTELLRNGAVPLDLLESSMKSWLDGAAKVDQP